MEVNFSHSFPFIPGLETNDCPIRRLPIDVVQLIIGHIPLEQRPPLREVNKWFSKNITCQITVATAKAAARLGSVTLLEWCRNRRIPLTFCAHNPLCKIDKEYPGHGHVASMRSNQWFSLHAHAALTNNPLITLSLIHTYQVLPKAEACEAAAFAGDLTMLRLLLGMGCPWDKNTIRVAALKGHLEVLRYAHQNGCPWDASTLLISAAASGKLEVVKYVHGMGAAMRSEVACAAAQYGSFEVLQYLDEKQCPHSLNDLCDAAIRRSRLDILIYLMGKGLVLKKAAYCYALGNQKDLKILDWLWDNKCPHALAYTYFPSYEGMLWLYSKGLLSFSEQTFSYAVGHKNLSILKWLLEHDCPFDDYTCYRIKTCENKEILEWGVEKGLVKRLK